MFREILKGSSLKLRVKVSGEESRDDEDEILRALTLKLRGEHFTTGQFSCDGRSKSCRCSCYHFTAKNDKKSRLGKLIFKNCSICVFFMQFLNVCDENIVGLRLGFMWFKCKPLKTLKKPSKRIRM